MASNYPSPPASPRRLDDLLICPVCLESFKDPRTLSCLHTFCTVCLESCKRAYRRDISCPVCKKVTHLPALGVHGLQSDFRVQQIRDILINQVPEVGSNGDGKEGENNKICDLCKTQQMHNTASFHCIQCYMYFCLACHEKHNNNNLFSSHHVINMGESNATEVLFCRLHTEHPVRYFCKPCSMMMCTICTMEHEQTHAPEPLEKGIITKYRKELEISLRKIHTKLSEVKSKAKYLETIKETHQKAMFTAQSAIREKTEEIIQKIKEQEQILLVEVQEKIDAQMRENGIDNLGEIKFYSSSIETLYSEIQRVIQGSPQQCLVAYEDLITRMKSISDSPMVPSKTSKEKSILKFIPSVEKVDIVIGTLQECSLEENIDKKEKDENIENASRVSSSPATRKRTTSILTALSPGRKSEPKMGKVKGYSSPKSPRSKINADDALRTASERKSDRPKSTPKSLTFSKPPTSTFLPVSHAASPLSSPGSPVDSLMGSAMQIPSPTLSSPSRSDPTIPTASTNSAGSAKFRMVFKVDQVGQWPGKITAPSGVAFLPDGKVVIAECENRLQVFDRSGQSVKIIGWGKIQPQRVIALPDGKIAATDRKDKCVKVYTADGDLVTSWGAGMFEMPAGIAVTSVGNYIISDIDKHMINIYSFDGTLIKQFGSWGSGDYQFNSPSNVCVDKDDNIYVSDSSNNSIKIYDSNGFFLRKFSLSSGKLGQARRPLGLTVANNGNVLVVDRENHRITMYAGDGKFLQHLLCKSDGLKYPCDVKLSEDNHIAVVETHSGFLTKDPHHSLKLFHIF